MRSLTKWLALGASAAVAACASPNEVSQVHDALRAEAPSGTPFVRSLLQEYQGYVKQQTQTDVQWVDATHFARKTFRISQGEAVQPEELTQWSVPAPALPELTAARTRLMGYISGGATERVPAATAKTQVAFDCWLEQTSQAQVNAAKACKTAFLTHERMLKKASPSVVEGPFDVKRNFAVNFDTASSALSDKSIQVLKDVVASGGKMNAPLITLTGYTDAVGSPAANTQLAQSRVNSVAAKLTTMGVNPAAIALHAAGAVPGNGAMETNRRVDIAIGGPTWDNNWRYGGYAYGGGDHGWGLGHGGYGANGFAVFFDLGSSNLSADSAERLKQMVNAQKHLKPKSADVVGFTDRTGSAATNQRLARDRAESVAAEISKLGGVATNVFSRPGDSWGVHNDGRARRVEILFHY